ncbi:MAG: hypothetical protein CM15mP49_04740 [Actinomycetota bacterium]|nr:MAG: hypothetical protein CM15mP49_04740 [Actinomycetota bacterium]
MIIATVVGVIAAYLLTNKSKSISNLRSFSPAPIGSIRVLLGFGILISLNTGFLIFDRWWIVPVAQGLLGVGIVARISSNAIKKIGPDHQDAHQP